jgi:5-methylcytosine-specific restriction endonuclease McrA
MSSDSLLSPQKLDDFIGQLRIKARLALAIAAARSRQEYEAKNRREVISSEVRREVWRRDEGKCVKCGSREKLEYDHIIPVAKGGSNTARNIELLCESCNRAKSDLIQ